MMSLAYIVTIAPSIVGGITLDAWEFKREDDVHEIINLSKSCFHLIYILSCVVNPILTLVGKPDYKRTYLAVFHGKKDGINSGSSMSSSRTINTSLWIEYKQTFFGCLSWEERYLSKYLKGISKNVKKILNLKIFLKCHSKDLENCILTNLADQSFDL